MSPVTRTAPSGRLMIWSRARNRHSANTMNMVGSSNRFASRWMTTGRISTAAERITAMLNMLDPTMFA